MISESPMNHRIFNVEDSIIIPGYTGDYLMNTSVSSSNGIYTSIFRNQNCW